VRLIPVETIENWDTFATGAHDSGFAQFPQSGGDGFAIDAQVLRDLRMRQIFDGVFLRTLK